MKRFLKRLLAVLGILLLLLVALGAWIYVARIAGPPLMELNEFHPFRSQEARTAFLAHERELARAWPVASIERTVSTSFGSTFMRVSGPVNAPPLVLLPGGGSTSLIWKANIAGLSSAFRVYALAHPERTARLVLLAPAGTVLPISGATIRRMVLSLIPARFLVSYVMYWVWDDLARSGCWSSSGRRAPEAPPAIRGEDGFDKPSGLVIRCSVLTVEHFAREVTYEQQESGNEGKPPEPGEGAGAGPEEGPGGQRAG